MASLEGLEINIKQLKELFNEDDDTFRLDSEHYRKMYLRSIERLSHLKIVRIKDIISVPVMTGHTPSMKIDRYYGGDIKFIKTDNLRNNRIAGDFSHYLSIEGNKLLSRSSLRMNDVITTIIGATHDIVGRTSIIQSEILPANINQNIALIRVNEKLINPSYLNIYLNTSIGKSLLHYHSRQTEQVNLNCREVERVIVPIFEILENKIEDVVKTIENLKSESKQTYAQAEEILLKEIGLLGFEPSHESVNIKSFAESFASTGRIDAEYYQPKYDAYLHLVKSYQHGCEPVSQACTPRLQNFTPESTKEYRYIELSNIGKTGDINGCTTALGEELPSRARRRVNRHDVIVSSIEGSLDSCALVTEEYHDALCSTGFYVLQPKKLNAETLLVLFKSELMQSLLKQGCSGTILTAINKDEFLGLPIPLIDNDTQKDIAALIQQSFALKQQSEHLLEVAKRAVEIAIEEDEDAALRYIEQKQGAAK